PAAAPLGKSGPTGQRMARRRQAQQTLLSPLSGRQGHAEALARRMAEHQLFLERNSLGALWNFSKVTCEPSSVASRGPRAATSSKSSPTISARNSKKRNPP